MEEQFARTGKKFRKSFLSRHERILVRPWLKFGLQIAGLYPRGLRNAISPVVRELRFSFTDLPPAFDGFQILQLADLHIDRMDGLTEALLPVIDGLRPDVCVLTGDYRFEDEGPCDEVYTRMRPIVSTVSAKYGIFGILGNHDDDHNMPSALGARGVQVLKDARTTIQVKGFALDLIGIRFWTRRTSDIAPLLRGASGTVILLAHDPRRFFEAAQLKIPLVLSGHTHGGQVVLPGIGAVAAQKFPVVAGIGRRDRTTMFVSRGVGTVYVPVRVNCPPEVAVLTLVPQTAGGSSQS